MKITFGAIVADARGKISGNVFSRNANGAYVRKNTAPINTSTTAQQSVRSIFGSIAQSWRDLTDAERDSWIQGAPDFPQTDSLGNTVILTAQQLFSKLNNSLAQVGLDTLTTLAQPSSYVAPFVIQVNIFVDPTDPTANNLEIDRTDGANLRVPEWLLLIEATRPMSAGVYRMKRTDFRQIGMVEPTGTALPQYTNLAAYTGVFGVPAPGTAIGWRFTYVNTVSGVRTSPLVVRTITAS